MAVLLGDGASACEACSPSTMLKTSTLAVARPSFWQPLQSGIQTATAFRAAAFQSMSFAQTLVSLGTAYVASDYIIHESAVQHETLLTT